MAIDLIKGGRIPQVVRTYLGPTVGWKLTDSPVYYQYTFDGGGTTPPPGKRGPLIIPDWLTIRDWYILATNSGSCTFDVYKVTLDEYLAGTVPGPANSICGGAPPTMTSATSATSSAISAWNTRVDQGDVLVFDLTSVSLVQQVTLILRCVRDIGVA